MLGLGGLLYGWDKIWMGEAYDERTYRYGSQPTLATYLVLGSQDNTHSSAVRRKLDAGMRKLALRVVSRVLQVVYAIVGALLIPLLGASFGGGDRERDGNLLLIMLSVTIGLASLFVLYYVVGLGQCFRVGGGGGSDDFYMGNIFLGVWDGCTLHVSGLLLTLNGAHTLGHSDVDVEEFIQVFGEYHAQLWLLVPVAGPFAAKFEETNNAHPIIGEGLSHSVIGDVSSARKRKALRLLGYCSLAGQFALVFQPELWSTLLAAVPLLCMSFVDAATETMDRFDSII